MQLGAPSAKKGAAAFIRFTPILSDLYEKLLAGYDKLLAGINTP